MTEKVFVMSLRGAFPPGADPPPAEAAKHFCIDFHRELLYGIHIASSF